MADEKKSNQKNERYFKAMSFGKKIQHIYDGITLEPLVVCAALPAMLLELSVQNLNLEKACRVNLNYNETVCDALSVRDTALYVNEEESVQRLVAHMTAWKTAIHSALPCLLILFFGSWSDRHGKRKPCILIPLFGNISMAFLLMLCVYFNKTPIELAIFVQVFFPSITGGHFTMLGGIFSYMADITNEKERTFRIGVVSIVYAMSVPFGMAFSGILLKKLGFYGVFALTGAVYSIAMLHGLFILKEVPPKEMNEQQNKKPFLADFFDFSHIKETFLVAFKVGDNHRRTKIFIIMVLVIIIIGPLFGELPIFYLFTRYKFNWSEVEFSFFASYVIGLHLIGNGLAIGVLSSMLKMEDALVGAIAIITKVPASLVYALAQVEWHMYIGPIVEMIYCAAIIAMRSLASKVVSSNELGKVNALFAIAESIAPLVYSPVLSTIYSATLTTMPGAFLLVNGFISIPGSILFLWFYKMSRTEAKNKEAVDNSSVDAQTAAVRNGKPCEMYIQNVYL